MPRTLPKRALSILDVGHGSCTVLHQDCGTVVIDTGGKNHLIEFLKTEEITEIDLLIITHADEDHIGGLVGLLSSTVVKVKRVMINADGVKHTATWRNVAYEIDASTRATAGLELLSAKEEVIKADYLGGITLRIEAPRNQIWVLGTGNKDGKDRVISSNTISVVARIIDTGGKPIACIGGDIDEIGLEHLLEITPDLSSSLLVFPHHGGRPGKGSPVAFAKALLEAVKPNTIVFSIGRRKHKNPLEEIVRVIAEQKNIHIACTQLSKNCSEDDIKADQPFLSQSYSHGKSRGECCAGTLTIDLDDDKKLQSWKDQHIAFISASVPKRICIA